MKTANTNVNDAGFKIFSVDPSTAVVSFSMEHVGDAAVLGHEINTIYTIFANSFAVSDDGLHVFIGVPTFDISNTYTDSGGVLHFEYNGTDWSGGSWFIKNTPVSYNFLLLSLVGVCS